MPSYFHHCIQRYARDGILAVQPRMGFPTLEQMGMGLREVKGLNIPAIGTITLDSFTRTGNYAAAREALRQGVSLNGFPIVSYSPEETCRMTEGIIAPGFPIQVRHGSTLALDIFKATLAAGIDAIEGGPLSYCFPYSRTPLEKSIEAWSECARMFADSGPDLGHIESFGGCMLGQLCPPSMLMAITVAEAMFFASKGVRSFSLSLTQGTSSFQDTAALLALRRLGKKYLKDEQAWHIVFYNFMGKFPVTHSGARRLIEEGARIAVWGKAERLIVKTVKEAHEIPSIKDNLDALTWTHAIASVCGPCPYDPVALEEGVANIFREADFLVGLLLDLDADPGKGLLKAFQKGYWDIPYCLHPDNRRQSSAWVDQRGYICWSRTGHIPFPSDIFDHRVKSPHSLSSAEFLKMLSYNQEKYDAPS